MILGPGGETLHWLQCDRCQKWRVVAPDVARKYEGLKFVCAELGGLLCGTECDWERTKGARSGG